MCFSTFPCHKKVKVKLSFIILFFRRYLYYRFYVEIKDRSIRSFCFMEEKYECKWYRSEYTTKPLTRHIPAYTHEVYDTKSLTVHSNSLYAGHFITNSLLLEIFRKHTLNSVRRERDKSKNKMANVLNNRGSFELTINKAALRSTKGRTCPIPYYTSRLAGSYIS